MREHLDLFSFCKTSDRFLPCPKCEGTKSERRFIYPGKSWQSPEGPVFNVPRGMILITCPGCGYVLATMMPADYPVGTREGEKVEEGREEDKDADRR